MVLENKYSVVSFDPEVLREYDIRGIVGDNINLNTAYSLGRAFSTVVQNKLNSNTIISGYDGRLTSPALHQALCEGLKDSGAKVLNVGMGPTPMIYFSHFHFNSDAAIMVTGSHNPSNYNGFKMVLNKHSFYSHEIQKLQNLISKNLLKKKDGVIFK